MAGALGFGARLPGDSSLTLRTQTWLGVRLDPLFTNRDLLLWDQLGVIGLERKIARMGDSQPQRAAELEYLAEREVIKTLPGTVGELSEVVGGRSLFGVHETTVPFRSLDDAMDSLREDPELKEGFERVLARALSRPSVYAVPLIADLNAPVQQGGREPTTRILRADLVNEGPDGLGSRAHSVPSSGCGCSA